MLAAGCGSEEVSGAGLVEAAGAGRLEDVRRVLENGADVNARAAHERTAVTAAAMREHVDVVRALVDAGADVDLEA